MKKKYLSFFSGALGLDNGLDQAGWESIAYIEYKKFINETIRANRKDPIIIDEDINKINFEELGKKLNIKKGELFAIAGGPPCQPFSTSGKGRALLDERGNAMISFVQAILYFQPKYFILENVRGIFYKSSEKGEPKGSDLYRILSLFDDSPYKLNFSLYDTSLYGVPQKRERFILIGSLESQVPLIPPTGESKSLKDAIYDLKDRQDLEHLTYSQERLKYFKMLKAGENWKNLPLKFQKEAMKGSFELGGGKTGFFRKLSWDKPSPTLLTSPVMNSTALCHPDDNRPLSIEEYMRIQTFPNNFELRGSLRQKYLQLGNAVPSYFAYQIGKHINKHFEGKLSDSNENFQTSRYKDHDYHNWLVNFKKLLG